MQVVGNLAAALAQVGDRAGAELAVAVGRLAPPDGQRRAPVALARERPVDVALEPLAEAPVLDVLGVPADLLVLGQHAVADLGRADVPARLRVVEQRGAAAPAVRVGVLVVLGAQQAPLGLERRDDLGVVVVDELALEVGDALVEAAVGLDRVLQRHPVLLAEAEVVLAEGERGVHEARAVVGGDEVAEQDAVTERAEVRALDVVERRLVADALERRPGQVAEDLHLLAEDLLGERSGDDQHLPADARADVLDLRSGGDRGVGDQRPRSGRPDDERVAGSTGCSGIASEGGTSVTGRRT